MTDELPGSVLFCCTLNSIRSPMAEAIMKSLHGRRIYVDSAGVREGETDPFAIEVVGEIGLDLSRHRPKPPRRRRWQQRPKQACELISRTCIPPTC